MNLTSLTAADFKQILGLLEQREELQAQAAKINAQLAAFERGEPAGAAESQPGQKPSPKPPAQSQPKPRRAKRAERGSVKAAIIGLIKGAGELGITVKEIAANLGVDYNRVFTWFYNTGKAIKEIKKAGPGKYSWVERVTPRAKPSPVPKALPVSKPQSSATQSAAKPAKGKGGIPGSIKDRVIVVLKDAGRAGIRVREVAGKLGLKPANIGVWFARTGKRVKQIKRLGKGKYAWVG